MSDSYVTSQATLKCSCGDKSAKLTVYPDRTVFLTGKPMANISDHKSMFNIAPFGKCRTTAYPPTGSATAANHGVLTPMPCVPGTISEWMNGKNDYIVKGHPALLKSSICRCQWGGIISITDDGQVDTGDADLSQYVRETEEDMLKKQEEEDLSATSLDTNCVLDGIQAALDIAGFAPGVGAIPDLINAAISACRGNWAEAGMSVLAAVPGIGDAAAGVKLAHRGVKIAKSAGKVGKNTKVGKSLSNTTNIEGVSKQAIKVEKEPTDISDYRKAKQVRLIDESPNVLRIPKQNMPISTSIASVEKGKGGDLIQMDSFSRKQVKVANGKVETVLERKTDTTVASIGGDDIVNPISGASTNMGRSSGNGLSNKGDSHLSKRKQNPPDVFSEGTLGKSRSHGENEPVDICKKIEEVKEKREKLEKNGSRPSMGV